VRSPAPSRGPHGSHYSPRGPRDSRYSPRRSVPAAAPAGAGAGGGGGSLVGRRGTCRALLRRRRDFGGGDCAADRRAQEDEGRPDRRCQGLSLPRCTP
jgi:hypothetical protein